MDTSSNHIDFCIIIPAKNEAERLGKTLDELAKYLKQHNFGRVEVVIVVNASDATGEVAKHKATKFEHFRVLPEGTHPGKGGAVHAGMLQSRASYRLFMDADLATPLHHLEIVQNNITAGADVIIGVRNLATSHQGVRKLISNFGNFLVHILLGLKLPDTQCGFKAFKGQVAEDIFAKQTIWGWGFDMEVLAVAKNHGYSIKTIAIDDWRDVEGGTFKNVAVSGALATFKDLLKIKWNLVRGKYRKSE